MTSLWAATCQCAETLWAYFLNLFLLLFRSEQPGRPEAVQDSLQQGPDWQAGEGVPQGELHLKVR